MEYVIEYLVQYKKDAALCGKYFKEDEVRKAKRFAEKHDTYHCGILVWQVDKSIPAPNRNRWLWSESPLPFKKNGKWATVFVHD